VLIHREKHPHIKPGRFYQALITDAETYDLYASVGE
jgi:hypothetical protein